MQGYFTLGYVLFEYLVVRCCDGSTSTSFFDLLETFCSNRVRKFVELSVYISSSKI